MNAVKSEFNDRNSFRTC